MHVIALMLLTWACFGRTLGGYFLADDFGEIKYVWMIFHGCPEHLWSSFIGPYIGNSTIHVYRPWMLMSQVIDCVVWGVNPFGFHLTNLLYYSGCVLLFYFFIKEVLKYSPNSWNSTAAFLAAALFAVSPLHCESVAWMIGRVDVICCFFYLLGLLLLTKGVREGNHLAKIAGLVAFAFALCTKEMAVGLPVVLTAVLFFFPKEQAASKDISTWSSLKNAFIASRSAWFLLAVYFLVRFLALGTVLGGYSGSVGASQVANMATKWFDPDTWQRILIPTGLLPGLTKYRQIIRVCEWAIGGFAIALILMRGLSVRRALFIGVWGLTALAPIYQLWGLGENLEGERFLFFFSMPLCALFPLLIFSGRTGSDRLQQRIMICAAASFVILIAALGQVCHKNAVCWVHAGKEVKAVLKSAQKLAASYPGKKVVLLGLPKQHCGAYQVMNDNIFNSMMEPPFSQSLARHFLDFDRRIYESPEFVNPSSLKSSLLYPENMGPYVWNSEKRNFELVNFSFDQAAQQMQQPEIAEPPAGTWQPSFLNRPPREFSKNSIRFVDLKVGDGLYIHGLKLNPLNTDYLQFEYRNTMGSGVIPCCVFWNVDSQKDLNPSLAPTASGSRRTQLVMLPCSIGRFTTASIKLSRYWQWFSQSQIDSLFVMFLPFPDLEIRNMRLCSAQILQPQLAVAPNCRSNNAGVIAMPVKGLDFVVSLPPGNKDGKIQVEISKTNFFFDPLHRRDAIRRRGKVVCTYLRTKLFSH